MGRVAEPSGEAGWGRRGEQPAAFVLPDAEAHGRFTQPSPPGAARHPPHEGKGKDRYRLNPSSPSQPPLVSRATSSRARGSGVLGGAAMNFDRQAGPNLDL